MIIIFEKFSKSVSYPTQRTKPEVDDKTITIRSNFNDLFHIDIFFDEEGRVDYISNAWNVALPDWYGMKISMIDVKSFVKKYGLYTNNKPRFYCGYLLDMEAKKYNL